MFGKMLSDLADVATDVAKVAVAPVAATAAVAKEVTKPIAEASEDAVELVRGEGNGG